MAISYPYMVRQFIIAGLLAQMVAPCSYAVALLPIGLYMFVIRLPSGSCGMALRSIFSGTHAHICSNIPPYTFRSET